jgi:hypothetical protein
MVASAVTGLRFTFFVRTICVDPDAGSHSGQNPMLDSEVSSAMYLAHSCTQKFSFNFFIFLVEMNLLHVEMYIALFITCTS